MAELHGSHQTEEYARRLVGKVAAVTGAGQGNGRAITLRLAREGASVFASDIVQDLLLKLNETLPLWGAEKAEIDQDLPERLRAAGTTLLAKSLVELVHRDHLRLDGDPTEERLALFRGHRRRHVSASSESALNGRPVAPGVQFPLAGGDGRLEPISETRARRQVSGVSEMGSRRRARARSRRPVRARGRTRPRVKG